MQPRRSSALVAAVLATGAVIAPVAVPALAGPLATRAVAAPATVRVPTTADLHEAFLTPASLRTAYDLDGLYAKGITGKGVVIGIVDSFGSPTIRNDLAVYDQRFGLPALTDATLQIVTPNDAPIPPFDPSDSDMAGWAGETTLDVEVAHTVAPDATIELIETPTSETEGLQGFPEIINAENAVLSGSFHGRSYPKVDVLSQSFAATEQTFTGADQIRGLSAQVYPAAEAAGVTVLSSSGDNGPVDYELDEKTLYDRPVTDWPASDPLVTAVGGTTLDLDASGSRVGPDAAWSGSGAAGGGVSTVFPRPAFQASVAGVVGSGRGVPDISLDADPGSGLITYQSYGGTGYSVGGGTSQAAPLMAGIVALADQAAGARVGYLDDALYAIAKQPDGGIVDVTHGSDACSCSQVPGYQAVAGYDLASGLGTVDAGQLVPAVVAATKGRTQPLAAAGGAPSTTPATSASSAAASPSPPGSSPAATRSSATPVPRADAAPATHDGSKIALAAVAAALLAAVAAGGGTVALRRRRPPTP